MKVKIGNHIYDPNDEPIMVILDDDDKKIISKMGTNTKFCAGPDTMTEDEIEAFMETE